MDLCVLTMDLCVLLAQRRAMGSDHRVTMDAIDVLGVAMRSIRQGNPGNAIDILADMQKQMRGIDWEADRDRIATLERERDEAREGLKAARAGLLREGLEVERLKALCGEAADEVVKVPGLIGLWKRLRAAKGE